ncbi:MAG: hypothetical protein IT371_22360 [Deltaproteobacteria bacterium]|nr:hypothetical protein [Deltaproteobacteria bacterium]
MRRTFHRRLGLASLLFAGVLLAGSGLVRAETRAVREAQSYAQQHALPSRWVDAGPAHRRTRRLFVAVTPQSFANFEGRFHSPNGYVGLCYTANHLWMGVEPGTCYAWGRNSPEHVAYYRWEDGAHFFPVDLAGQKIQHLLGWLAPRRNTPLYSGNCMEWLPNAEVAPNLPLFHLFGIRRSKDGPNMRRKIVHAANGTVDVVGMCVRDAATFNAMSDAQLLGAPPSGGTDDAAR